MIDLEITNKAIARITEEMMNAGDEMTRTLEEYLTSICVNEKVAERLLDQSKTLKEFMKQLWQEASKRQKQSRAVITSEEIIPMLESYFGITEEDKEGITSSQSDTVIDIFQFL